MHHFIINDIRDIDRMNKVPNSTCAGFVISSRGNILTGCGKFLTSFGVTVLACADHFVADILFIQHITLLLQNQ
jgi:hypothetical protein